VLPPDDWIATCLHGRKVSNGDGSVAADAVPCLQLGEPPDETTPTRIQGDRDQSTPCHLATTRQQLRKKMRLREASPCLMGCDDATSEADGRDQAASPGKQSVREIILLAADESPNQPSTDDGAL